jgi:ABC-2 type transport system permease protein
MRRFADVAGAVAWRSIHRFMTNPQLLLPSLIFPMFFFVAVFLSSNALPRDLIEQDWFRAIATVDPVSYLFEGLRSLVIFGWDGEALALGFGVAIAIALLGVLGAASALRTRLVRT